jgi:ectoine hydroxylase-related dioxygenase (phytanoyl-CoA dioxygenase family)
MNAYGLPSDAHQRYSEDGVAFLHNVLDKSAMRKVEAAYDWSYEHLTGALQNFAGSDDERFIADTNSSARRSIYQTLLRETPIADIAQALFGGDAPTWYLGEQIFYKQGPQGTRRTPWHQDSSYGNFEGPKMAVIWIPLDPVPREQSLEVVRGSHLGTTYNGSRFEPGNDTAPLYPVSDLPQLPDIEGDRSQWDIAGAAMQMGDLMAFHMSALHGGGSTLADVRRRSLSLRFIGDDVVWIDRDDVPHPNSSNGRRARARADGKAVAGASSGRAAPAPIGAPVWRSGKFMQVRPWVPWEVRD